MRIKDKTILKEKNCSVSQQYCDQQYCDQHLVINKYREHMAPYLLRSSKTSGRRKLRRDQSSAKLFCSGVPVSSSLLSVGNIFSSRTSRQLRFLILWPSSTIRYFHWKRWSREQTSAGFLYSTRENRNMRVNKDFIQKRKKKNDRCRLLFFFPSNPTCSYEYKTTIALSFNK